MKNTLRMDISDTVQNLLQHHLDLLLVRFIFFAGDVFFEVVVVEIKHYLKHLFLRFIEDID